MKLPPDAGDGGGGGLAGTSWQDEPQIAAHRVLRGMRAAAVDVVMAINETRRSRHPAMTRVALPPCACACAPQARYQGPMLLLSTIVVSRFKATGICDGLETTKLGFTSGK